MKVYKPFAHLQHAERIMITKGYNGLSCVCCCEVYSYSSEKESAHVLCDCGLMQESQVWCIVDISTAVNWLLSRLPKVKNLYHTSNTVTNLCFAALLSAENKDRLLKEVSIMLSFHHPNVMPLTGMCFDGEVPLLIMPFMSGGSVLNHVCNNRDDLHFDKGSQEEQVLLSLVYS